MVKRILTGVSCYSSRYYTTTYDSTALNKDNHVPNISFAYFATTNLHYGAFGELVKDLPFSGLVSCFVVITYYGWYDKLVEGLNLATTFKDHKKGGVNVDGKNGGIESDGEDVEDDKVDNEDSAMDTEFIIDPDVDVMIFGEANKGDKNTASTLLCAVGKGVGNVDKNVLLKWIEQPSHLTLRSGSSMVQCS